MNKSQLSQQQKPPLIPQKPTNNNNNHVITSNNKISYANDDSKINYVNNNKKNGNNKVIWDCGSSLYDSFERDSFRKQLDSAIVNSSRTLSMPRLPSQDSRAEPPPQVAAQPTMKKTASSKLSRSFQKLIRSVFRASKPKKSSTKPNSSTGSASPDPWFFDSPVSYDEETDGNNRNGNKVEGGNYNPGKYYVVYEKPNMSGLTAIPEVPEVNSSPEIGRSLVRKTMSDRFTHVSRGIYCN